MSVIDARLQCFDAGYFKASGAGTMGREPTGAMYR